MPDATAIVHADRRLGYRDLDERANRLARYLRVHNVGPEVVVGLHLPRSIDFVVGLLAVFKAGGAFVTLDPASPAERWHQILAATRPAVILAAAPVDDLPLLAGSRLVRLDTDAGRIAAQPAGPAGTAPTPDTLAFISFTSGSTGAPRGILQTHRGSSSRVAWHVRNVPYTADDVVVVPASFTFHSAIWQLFTALAAGSRAILATADEAELPDHYVDLLIRQGVTRATAPSPFPRALLEIEDLDRRLSPDLRFLVGGEATPTALVRAVARRLPGRVLWCFYAASEMSGLGTHFDTCRSGWEELDRVPADRPYAGSLVRVLDDALRPVPPGEAGEVCVGGLGLARGYLNDPEATAQKFIPDPFAVEPGGRLYRTGDRGRILPDGSLEILGRIDRQVKIRGLRIKPEGVEFALCRHGGVRQAAVIAHEGQDGER